MCYIFVFIYMCDIILIMNTSLTINNEWPPVYLEPDLRHISLEKKGEILTISDEFSTISSPGILAPTTLVPKFIECIKGCIRSLKNFDREGFFEYLLQALNIPFGITSSIEKGLVLFYLFFQGVMLVALSTTATIFSFVFLGVEFFLETARFLRSYFFKETYNLSFMHACLQTLNFGEKEMTLENVFSYLQEIEKFFSKHKDVFGEQIVDKIAHVCHELILETDRNTIKNDWIYLQNLVIDIQTPLIQEVYEKLERDFLKLQENEREKILLRAEKNIQNPSIERIKHEYIRLTQIHLTRKINLLARRVRDHATREIFKEVPAALTVLKTGSREDKKIAIRHAIKLFQEMKEQSNKIMMIHLVGIIAIFLGVISVIGSLVVFPFAVPVTIGVLAVVFQLMRLYAPKAYLDELGYTKINWKAPLPKWLIKKPKEEKLPNINLIEMTTFKKG